MAKKQKRGYYTPKKKHKIWPWIVATVALLVVCAFFITSLCLAHAHSVTMVEEWRNWFGIVKDAEPAIEAAAAII